MRVCEEYEYSIIMQITQSNIHINITCKYILSILQLFERFLQRCLKWDIVRHFQLTISQNYVDNIVQCTYKKHMQKTQVCFVTWTVPITISQVFFPSRSQLLVASFSYFWQPFTSSQLLVAKFYFIWQPVTSSYLYLSCILTHFSFFR